MSEHFPRLTTTIDFDWRFHLGDPVGAHTADYDDSAWRVLDLPHDWSIEGEYAEDNPSGTQCGFLPTGIGWYRKELVIPEDERDPRYELQFDGIYMNSEVWCGGISLGKRPYGYISVNYDLTGHLRPGRNVIAVKVDASLQPSSRWYNGSGIYGHVKLARRGAVHVPTWATYITTPEITGSGACVHIETAVMSDHAGTARVRSAVLDPSGASVAEVSSSHRLAPGVAQAVAQDCRVPAPRLWSPDTPHLYTLRTQIWEGGTLRDLTETTFGIRSIEVNASKGFLLNGVPTKLKGVCNHHDAGPVGAAVPENVLERRIRLLKEMGCNAIRTAHNPRKPAFYDLCDRMGMMVMDEIFDGWKTKQEQDYGGLHFADWWRRDVADWVRRDRNHPCVVMWSIGNETGTDDEHDISGFIKTFDDTRPVTGGDVHSGVDVSGFNGKAEVPGFLETFKAEHPDQPIVLTEVPHTYQTRGFYRVLNWWSQVNRPRFEIPSLGEKQIFFDGHFKFSSSYDNSGIRMCARQSWKRTREHDWIIGEFRWTGFDYLGETFPGSGWPIRFWSHGIIDLCGFPKDHYFLYQSFWTEKPMVHILPHWTHRGMEGTTIPVVVYSNCDTVELFLNGISLGVKHRGELLDFQWQVPYEPGELKAVAFKGNKKVAGTAQRTASDPVELRLVADNTDLIPDRRDIAHLTFTAHDAKGTLVPWSNDPIHVEFKGPVRHLGFENGNHTDLTPHRIKQRNIFHGMGLGIFQATGEDGPIEITAAGILGDDVFADHVSVAIVVNRIALRGDLADTDIQIHYTTDGSEPSPAAPQYEAPIALTRSATVRTLVVRDGRPFMRFERAFTKGEREPVTDPRLVLPNGESSVQVDGFVGPFAKEVVGTWKLWRRRLQFRPDGTVVESFRTDERPPRDGEAAVSSSVTAYWWYDYPLDLFEDPDDTGQGEIRWASSGETFKLVLSSRGASAKLTMPDCTHLTDLTRDG
ncbi:MAG: glycoside hydrolase family 2 TIM barrel-domain containing protein [Lentisphaeria bacterium]|nr:glycoside hydrolase family 2 TIM barrel-domain containing protein [Lentisphaeria bacterium]